MSNSYLALVKNDKNYYFCIVVEKMVFVDFAIVLPIFVNKGEFFLEKTSVVSLKKIRLISELSR